MIFKKQFALAITSACLTACTHAPDRIAIEGFIKSENGAPMGNIEISVLGPSVFTDELGYFCYEHGYPPNHEISLLIARNSEIRHEEILPFGSYELDVVATTAFPARDMRVERRAISVDFGKGFYCSQRKRESRERAEKERDGDIQKFNPS